MTGVGCQTLLKSECKVFPVVRAAGLSDFYLAV